MWKLALELHQRQLEKLILLSDGKTCLFSGLVVRQFDN